MDSKLNITFKKLHEFKKIEKTDLDHDLIWFPRVLMNIKTRLPFGKVQPLSGGFQRPLLSLFGGGGGSIRTPASQLSYDE